jgi:hypothetical protein
VAVETSNARSVARRFAAAQHCRRPDAGLTTHHQRAAAFAGAVD